MNKLFSVSKIAAICLSVVLVVKLVFACLDKAIFSQISLILDIALPVAWIVFFALVIKNSVKSSVLTTPSWICLASAVFYLFSIIIAWGTSSAATFSSLNAIMSVLYIISMMVGFFWLAKYFAKHSSQRAASILVPCALIFNTLVSIFIPILVYNTDSIQMTTVYLILSVVYTVIGYGVAIFFFFAFSKLKK